MTRDNFQKLQKLQEILKGTVYNINLPTLVFLGSQSSGKSSVLERLIHCDILPKGYEITTKCPIEINLRNTDNEEYMMLKERKYTFAQGKIAIQKEMDKLCKIDYISQTPIQIDIYTRDCIEISLVDLPGLTKIPLKDQPVDIEKQIYDLTMKYIKNDNCILLPIIPANADISTAEVLKICKEVDKDCKRTLGVITKIDLMDAGTDCFNILTNKIATLEMGYVGVINRGQSELGKKHNLLSVSEKEMLYFKNHEVYSKLWPRIGLKHLEDTLKGCFETLVDQMLPKINSEISLKLQEIEHKIEECTNYLSLDSAIASYGKTVKNVLKEKHIKQDNLFTYESDRNFMHEFKEALFVKNASIKFDKRTIDEIEHSNSIFVSDSLFEKIVNSYFDSYRINTINSFDIVASAIVNHIDAIACHQYPRFAEKAASVLKTCLQNELKNLKKYYNDFMKVHTSCINTSNPDFSKRKILHNVISKYVKSKKDKENSKYFGMFTNAHSVIDVNEKFDIELIYEFTHTYFECNRKIMADHAMKSAYYYLVNNFGKNVLGCLKEHHSVIGNIYEQEIEKFAEASNSLHDEKSTYQKLYDAINKQ